MCTLPQAPTCVRVLGLLLRFYPKKASSSIAPEAGSGRIPHFQNSSACRIRTLALRCLVERPTPLCNLTEVLMPLCFAVELLLRNRTFFIRFRTDCLKCMIKFSYRCTIFAVYFSHMFDPESCICLNGTKNMVHAAMI